MAGDPKKNDPKTGDPDPDPKDDLGDAGKRALAAERQRAKDAEKAAEDLRKELDELKGKDKSETEKLNDRVAAAERRASEAEAKVLRLEVAASKGLTESQARRLVGATREELERDADEFLESIGKKPGDTEPGNGSGSEDPKGPPSSRPKPNLSGGSDPTGQEPVELDPAKLAASVPRQ